MRPAAGGLARAAVLVGALTVAARLTGFGRVLVFSGTVGAGCTGSAYAAANQLPNVLFEIAAGGLLAGAVVPVLAGMLAGGRPQDAERTASALLTWTVVGLTPLAVLLAVLAGPLTSALLAGGCPGSAALAARMLVVFAPQVVLYGVGIVLTGVLQAHRRFAGPAVAPLLSSLVVVAAYLGFGALTTGGAHRGADGLPDAGAELVLSVGTTLGVAALSLPLLLPAARTGFRLRPTFTFPPGVAVQVRALAAAGAVTLAAQQASVLVTIALANRVGGAGALNVVQYVQAVYLLPYAVLAVPVATAAFPRLSEQAGPADRAAFARTCAAATRAVVLVSLAGTALLVAAAPAVQDLFSALDVVGGGPLGSLADALTAFALGLVGWGVVANGSRTLYALRRGRAAAVATSAGWAVAVPACVLAVLGLRAGGAPGPRAAVVGLGLGTTLGMWVAGGLLLLAVRRAAGPSALAGTARSALAGGLAVVLGGGAGRLVAVALGSGSAVSGSAGTGSRPAGVLGALAAGAAAALAAAVVAGAVAAASDRDGAASVLRRLRQLRRGRVVGGAGGGE